MAAHSTPPDEARGLQLIVRALHHPNYRLFFGGQGISLIGTWLQIIAMSWLVYRLTKSAFILGAVGFVGGIPGLLLGPFAGALADRWPRRSILVITQSLAALQAFVLAALVVTKVISIWHILPLSMFLGIVTAFDAPVRQSFVVDVVEKKDLSNAIALNSSLFNSARLLGPTLAGLLIAAVGEWPCFLLNGISYLAVIAALLAMRIARKPPQAERASVLQDLKAGIAYAFGFEPIRALLLLAASMSLVAMPYTVLMPIFASKVLHGGPRTLGFLMAATGVGALAGALYLASRRTVLGLGRTISLAVAVAGVGLVAFSRSQVFWLALPAIFVVGLGMMIQMASTNTVLQTIVDDSKRGRVMSLYAMAFMGMSPFGSLLAGALASQIGAPDTVALGGCMCLLGSLTFARKLPALRRVVHPIYVNAGILPPMPTIQPPTGLDAPPELPLGQPDREPPVADVTDQPEQEPPA